MPLPEPDHSAPKPPAPDGRLDAMRAFGQFGALGLSLAIAVGLGVAAGVWLDRITGRGPLFFIIFFILGFAAGVVNVYRTISRIK
jgi:ATP synthase protein I